MTIPREYCGVHWTNFNSLIQSKTHFLMTPRDLYTACGHPVGWQRNTVNTDEINCVNCLRAYQGCEEGDRELEARWSTVNAATFAAVKGD